MDFLKKLYTSLYGKDVYTWIGHFVAGFLLALVFNPLVAAVTFAYREISDFLGWWKDPRIAAQTYSQFLSNKSKYKKNRMAVLRDGFGDMVSPVLGAAAAVAVKIWLG